MGEQRSTACGSRVPGLRSREGREGCGCVPLRLDDGLERDALELLDSHVDGVRPAPFKDVGLQVLGALVAQRLQRRAALCRVRLLDEDDRLALLERRADLAEAVLVARKQAGGEPWGVSRGAADSGAALRARRSRARDRAARARLGAEVATREEEEDDLRVLDVLLQRPNILEIIHLCAHRGASEGLCVAGAARLSLCARRERS